MPTMPPIFRRSGHAQVADYKALRGSSAARGYDKRWASASLHFRNTHPLCLGCEAVDIIRATEVTDHVEPHRGDMVKFWDSDMWQPACQWHHSVVKQRLELLWVKGKIDLKDLWLNSAVAKALTERLGGPPR